MAGAVEQGFPEDPNEEDNYVSKVVVVETPMFIAETIGLFQLPGMKVLDAMTTQGIEQFAKYTNLFILSINDPQKADLALMLDFVELTRAVSQWVRLSQEFAPLDDEDLLGG